MKKKYLKPISVDNKDVERLEKELIKVIRETLYIPLIKELKINDDIIQNSLNDLISAIRTGKIYFVKGQFKGKLNATLTKEIKKLGAEWNRSDRTFHIGLNKLPLEIRSAIEKSDNRFEKVITKINKKLKVNLPKEIVDNLKLDKIFDKTIFSVDDKIDKSMDAIEVQQILSKKDKEKIVKEYTDNMDLYIQRWSEKEIVKLRKRMQKQVMAGTRYEGMISTIQKSYGVSKSKAKFLARQETKLLTSKLKEIRYTKAGVEKYEWRNVIASPKHPVRPMHARLNKTIQRWDDPPIVNDKGDRKHPGEDFNCRCTAHPVIYI